MPRLHMWARMVAALAIGPILVACSGAAQPTIPSVQPTIAPSIAATEASAPTPSPAPTPEPTADIAAIAQQYLKFSSDFTTAQLAGNAALDKATNDKEAIAAYQQQVDAADKAIADLGAIEFPPELQAARDTLVEAFTILKKAFEQLVKDPNDPDPTIDTRLDDAAAKVRSAGTLIRAALGLPPPQTPAPS